MSNFNMAKLRTDFAIEEYDEYQGLTDYFGKKDSDAAEADKYYKWAVAEVQSYVQNNSKMIGMTMAAQQAAQR